jgi:hypothetical protein
MSEIIRGFEFPAPVLTACAILTVRDAFLPPGLEVDVESLRDLEKLRRNCSFTPAVHKILRNFEFPTLISPARAILAARTAFFLPGY